MQLFTNFTQEDLNTNIDPLFLLCHPIGKLQLISDLLVSFDNGKQTKAFDGYASGTAVVVGDMILDAISEIKAVQEAVYHQYSKLKDENTNFAEKLKLMMPAYDLAQSVKFASKNG